MAKKIVLDAGHGLNTPGKRTPDDVREWELNNKVALAVARQLADYDVEIHRTDDVTGKTDVTLYDRIVKANRIMPDVLVSIHHNAYNGKWGNHTGVEAYYNLNRRNDFEKTLATEMAAAISANTGLKNRGAKTAAFYMLTPNAKIAAVLTESGFMDSIIDNPIITSTKGQEAYAKAISDVLIKQLKLTKKTGQEAVRKDEPTTIPPSTTRPIIGGRYTLAKATPGFYTSADARAGSNQRVTVQAGEYTIFNIANGMLNLTRVPGSAGTWINPGTTVATVTPPATPTTNVTVGGKYTLAKNTPGYYTAADARAGTNQRVSMLAGEFYIFNIANGMINITKTKGVPGAWINPDVAISTTSNTTTTSVTTPTIGGKFTLSRNTSGFYTAADANANRNPRVTVLAGDYFVFNIANGMINVTKMAGKPGSWINPR